MPDLNAEVASQLTAHAPQRRYLAGISGGCDSVALLQLLLDHGYRNLVVVHVNHRLRGTDSSRDAAFVRRMSEKHDLPYRGFSIDVAKLAAREKKSLETAARDCRYRCFALAAREHRCQAVFLAHHADDQVETVLMNLFRGAASKGLGGMHAVSSRKVEGRKLMLIRPLLGLWRADLEAWVRNRRLSFRQDASNRDPRFLRNRVRQDLLPCLEEVFRRDVRPMILRLAAHHQALQEWLAAETKPWVAQTTLPVALLRQRPMAWRQAVMTGWLRERGVVDVSFELVARALSLIEPAVTHAKVNLPGDRHLRRRAGRLLVE